MSSNIASAVPSGKYNRWCERRPLICGDEEKLRRSDVYVRQDNLTYSEKTAFYLHELVNCEGLEFVAFSNIRLNEPIELPGHITIVPCFLPNLRNNIRHPLAQLTIQMATRSRFIYDGWLPIGEWEVRDVREAIIKIDSALSLFALRCSAWFSWEPKYSGISRQDSYYEFNPSHVREIGKSSQFIDSLSSVDASALLRSIAWLVYRRRINR